MGLKWVMPQDIFCLCFKRGTVTMLQVILRECASFRQIHSVAVERNARHGEHVLNASGSERPVAYPKCDPNVQKNAKDVSAKPIENKWCNWPMFSTDGKP